MEISKPDYTHLWSSGGSIVAPSNVKIQTGWTAEVPPFQWENWSQNRQDQAIAHVLQHGISVWDAVTEYQAGKSYVQGSDGLLYKALQTHVGQNPVTDTTFVYWAKSLSGGLLNVQVFNASGTYTPTPGTSSVVVEVQGGGGSGGGAGVTPAGNVSAGNGGGAGGYSKSRITSGFNGVVVTVGAGGASASATGNSGSASSFGSLLSASGGGGGALLTATATFPVTLTSAAQGVGSLGNLQNSSGVAGTPLFLMSTNNISSGAGGSSHFGGGGGQGTANASGAVGLSIGSGGGGAISSNGGTAQASGSGRSGIVIVWEYA